MKPLGVGSRGRNLAAFVHKAPLNSRRAERLAMHRAGMSIESWQPLHHFANSKKFLTPEDVRGLGYSERSFRRHARALGWSRRYDGIWVPSGVELDYRDQLLAVRDLLGPATLFTGATALFLDEVIDEPPDEIEVLVALRDTPAHRTGICFHHTSTFDRTRYHRRGDLRVVNSPRAFADDAVHTELNPLCRRAATAIRKRGCTVKQLEQELLVRKRFPGRTRFRLMTEMLRAELVHSSYEKLARRLLRDAGHRPLSTPMTIELGGRLIAEIDIPFLDITYGVEVDGPHHLLPDVARADRHRDNKLEAIEWKIDRFWWDEIESRQQYFIQQVNAQIARRSQRRTG